MNGKQRKNGDKPATFSPKYTWKITGLHPHFKMNQNNLMKRKKTSLEVRRPLPDFVSPIQPQALEIFCL